MVINVPFKVLHQVVMATIDAFMRSYKISKGISDVSMMLSIMMMIWRIIGGGHWNLYSCLVGMVLF